MHSLNQMLDSYDKKSIVLHGFIAAWYLGISMIDLTKIPAFNSENKDRRRFLVMLYEWINNAIMFFSGDQTCIALWRQFRLKDELLQKMRPFKIASRIEL